MSTFEDTRSVVNLNPTIPHNNSSVFLKRQWAHHSLLCEDEKHDRRKRYSVWSGDLFYAHAFATCWGTWWYDTCVWFHIQLVAAALQWDKILDSFANHSYTKHRSIAFRSLLFICRWTLRTNVCGVRSGEAGCHWDLSYNAASLYVYKPYTCA